MQTRHGAQTPIATLESNNGVSASAVSAALSGSSEKAEKEQLTEVALPHDGFSDVSLGGEPFPNAWAKFRNKYKEPLAEFIATAILIIFGNGVNCQVVLSKLTQGSYLSISHGWGIGVMAGVYAAGGISGAHLSPAVTISLATYRGFPWRKVPGYILAQVLGACFGSCLIQGNYHALLNQYEGGYNVRTFGLETSTATLFFTGPQPYMSNIGAFCSELLATAVLLFIILSLGDANNNPAPPGMNGVILYIVIMGIGAALGTETAYCLNPARDLGPRIAAAMYGYPSTIWTDRNCYWIYVPIIATICGGLVGCFTYDTFVFAGPESPLNKPWRGLPWSRKNRDSDEGTNA
ncbi:aquaporin [Cystobasidium minutum MCA 4210]|uniref:aquaporin n=1 Tax=Cystobasidium minutum MCA 4210 TaxID=1397322 RepID=UPI0034CF43D2|eukprot:jgi/Rhomi1/141127/e_gw1.2.630.1